MKLLTKESEPLVITDSDIENWWVSMETIPEAAK
jgi:hypothetical protein